MGSSRIAGASLCPKSGVRYFEPIYAYQRIEATEMWLSHGSIAVPCTPFSDGEVKSKYRNPGFWTQRSLIGPARAHLSFFFSVTPWLRGVLLIFGCGFYLSSTPMSSVTRLQASEDRRQMETECRVSMAWKSRSFRAR